MKRSSNQPPSGPKPQVEKLLYTQEDAAHALSVSLRTIGYMIANKRIKFRRIGSRVLIPKTEVVRISKMDTLDVCSPVKSGGQDG